MGIYSQGAGWGSAHGKLLKANIRDKGISDYAGLTGFLVDRLGYSDTSWVMAEEEEPDQGIGQGVLVTLI